jgi:flagellar assembly factor FliW
VHVNSSKLGELDIDEDTVITFPNGLLGFLDARRFALIASHDSELYFWLQSIDDPSLAFLTASPWPFFPDYEPMLTDDDREALQLEDPNDATVLCLLTVDRASEDITVNLLGPLVINTATRSGRQVVLVDSTYPTRASLRSN